MSYVVAFAVSATLTGGLLWAVARWSSLRLPTPDLVIIAVCCSGLAGVGWVFGSSRAIGAGWFLGLAIMWLLVTRTTDADVWPDAVLMVAGSGVIWIAVPAALTMLGA
jgi:hypothetical protein